MDIAQVGIILNTQRGLECDPLDAVGHDLGCRFGERDHICFCEVGVLLTGDKADCEDRNYGEQRAVHGHVFLIFTMAVFELLLELSLSYTS